MVKEPRPGQVKTRLGREIGMTAAAWWIRHRVRTLARSLADPRWDLVLAVAPDRAVDSRLWPAGIVRWPQGPGDLGDRMGHAFRRMPPGPVVIVGADIPALAPRHIAAGFAALGRCDAVIGPAADGGYWLIGLKRVAPPPPGLFRGVRWSGPHAMADTLATLGDLSVSTLETLSDVDTAADLAALRRGGGALPVPP